ncbi:hypothetical protein V5O48_001332 [Marasmius crinis-equi]|uniref:DUF6533 domain-containing protein n=1 Tax=Marasmius crinis-equi TaxID=585013 RepID=A0ABR3FYS3_9AGAR
MPSEPAVLLDYMFELHINVLIEYSSIAILIFDYMLTFGKYVREVRYVWFNAPWNFGRVLYLLTRYLPFGGVFLTLFVDVTRGTSLSTCKILTQLAVYATVVDIIIAEIILMMRVWVIWARSRYISYALAATTIGLASVSIVTISTVPVSQDTFGADLNVTYGVCPPYFAGPNAGAITTCYMVLEFDAVLLVLTLIKAIDLYREWWKLYLSRNEHCSCDLNEGHLTGGTSNMINVFFADGLSYNAMILACSAANIIVRYRTAGTEYINLLASFVIPSQSMELPRLTILSDFNQ